MNLKRSAASFSFNHVEANRWVALEPSDVAMVLNQHGFDTYNNLYRILEAEPTFLDKIGLGKENYNPDGFYPLIFFWALVHSDSEFMDLVQDLQEIDWSWIFLPQNERAVKALEKRILNCVQKYFEPDVSLEFSLRPSGRGFGFTFNLLKKSNVIEFRGR